MLGVAAFGAIVLWKKINSSIALKLIVAFAVLPALLLDLIFVHHPKLGHIVGFIVGWSLGLYYLFKKTQVNERHKSANKHFHRTAVLV